MLLKKNPNKNNKPRMKGLNKEVIKDSFSVIQREQIRNTKYFSTFVVLSRPEGFWTLENC